MAMQSETTQETRERLKAMSAAEREGMEASQGDQLAVKRDPVLDERAQQIDSISETTENAIVEAQGALYTNDIKDEENFIDARPQQRQGGRQQAQQVSQQASGEQQQAGNGRRRRNQAGEAE